MRAQYAEAGIENRVERSFIGREGIITRTEQREILFRHPFEKLDRFSDLLHGKRRRVRAQFGDDLPDARQHVLPIFDAHPDIGEDAFEGLKDLGALPCIVEAFDVKVDQALAVTAYRAGAPELDKSAGKVAFDDEHRMHEKAD